MYHRNYVGKFLCIYIGLVVFAVLDKMFSFGLFLVSVTLLPEP
jgi:hypothetical protein